jgi:glycosyltransferase involved in cell wall biosynthesis
MQPRLSIITINFNNKAGLIKTSQSVFEQTFTNYEYILIDGGSTDGSVAHIELNRDKFSYCVSEPDKGIYNAMNKGILQAKGEYVQFLNSGDWLVNDSVLSTVFADLPACDMVYTNMIKVLPGGKLKTDKGLQGKEISFRSLYQFNINHSSVFIRRSLFSKYGMYDEQYKIISDWKFFLVVAGLNPATVIYKNVDVAYFDMTGISNLQRDLLRAEKGKVLAELVPLPILKDYQNSDEDITRLAIIRKHFITARIFRLLQITLVQFSRLLDRLKGQPANQ